MDILQRLNEIVKEYRPGVVLAEDSNFAALGFDSLDRVQLIMTVEDEFGIEFPEEFAAETVAEVIAKIKELTE